MREAKGSIRNLDAEIDPALATELGSSPGHVYGHHNAQDFHGYVWFESDAFWEEVWQHRRRFPRRRCRN